MKRISTLLLLSFAVGGTLSAKQIDEQTAAQVAQNFIASKMTGNERAQLKLASTSSQGEINGSSYNTYYVFDVNDKKGFVVVSADDIVKPILAYSNSTEFQTGMEGLSPETKYWMRLYSDQIYFAIINNIQATKGVEAEWQYYLTTTGGTANKPTNSVAPLLNTTWNQGTYYNIYTPGSGSTKTPVGCVATAMAQIMKYWNAPTTGTGSYSYTHQTYGVQSADFGATTYQWGLMPNSLNSSSSQAAKEAVSLLGYHCAVSVRMDFAPSGSGSQVLAWSSNSRCAENAFKNHFGYKTTIEGVYRDDYTDVQWLDMLKNELDNARPILYAGFGQVGGHAFVFDGYDENDLFHINWGWGSMSDGYFTVNNLAPSALGIGGGGGNFNDGQQALIKIEPAQPGDTLNMVMNAALTATASTINKGESFSVTAGIWNRGTLDYSGHFSAGIYRNTDSSLVGYLQYITNQVLMSGDDTLMTFTTPGLSAMGAGEYFIKALYRLEGASEWHALPDDIGFVNKLPLTVTEDPTGIQNTELEKSFTVYPNPANNNISVNKHNFSGNIDGVHLFNIQGQKVGAATVVNTAITDISLRHLANGIYYLRIVTDQGTATKKITIRH